MELLGNPVGCKTIPNSRKLPSRCMGKEQADFGAQELGLMGDITGVTWKLATDAVLW